MKSLKYIILVCIVVILFGSFMYPISYNGSYDLFRTLIAGVLIIAVIEYVECRLCELKKEIADSVNHTVDNLKLFNDDYNCTKSDYNETKKALNDAICSHSVRIRGLEDKLKKFEDGKD